MEFRPGSGKLSQIRVRIVYRTMKALAGGSRLEVVVSVQTGHSFKSTVFDRYSSYPCRLCPLLCIMHLPPWIEYQQSQDFQYDEPWCSFYLQIWGSNRRIDQLYIVLDSSDTVDSSIEFDVTQSINSIRLSSVVFKMSKNTGTSTPIWSCGYSAGMVGMSNLLIDFRLWISEGALHVHLLFRYNKISMRWVLTLLH